MRKEKREIKEFQEMIDVLTACEVCRLAFFDETYPYILPLNYGIEVEGEKVALYFHGAMEGRKYELLEKNPKVCFEVDRNRGLFGFPEEGFCTMSYESVIGQGTLAVVTGEERMHGMRILMEHYYPGEEFPIHPAVMEQTCMLKLEVEHMTGKRRPVPVRKG